MGPLYHCSADLTEEYGHPVSRNRNSGLVFVGFSHPKKKQYCSVNLDLPTPDFSEKIKHVPTHYLILWLLQTLLTKISRFRDFILQVSSRLISKDNPFQMGPFVYLASAQSPIAHLLVIYIIYMEHGHILAGHCRTITKKLPFCFFRGKCSKCLSYRFSADMGNANR